MNEADSIIRGGAGDAEGNDFETPEQGADVSGGIEITCTQCYLKGTATAELSAGHFNMSRVVDETIEDIGDNFDKFSSEIVDFVEDWVEDLGDAFVSGDFDFDAHEMPTFPFDFDMDVPTLPEVGLSFGFDSFELFMLLDTTLSLGSTYTYNLYTSNTPIGAGISDDLWFGVVFSVDLILAVDGEIDISSGFHIKLDDGLKIEIALFGDEASGIDL